MDTCHRERKLKARFRLHKYLSRSSIINQICKMQIYNYKMLCNALMTILPFITHWGNLILVKCTDIIKCCF